MQAAVPHICKTGSLLVSSDSQEPPTPRAAQGPVGSLGMPLGRHSFMPDHFSCPGCRARRRVRSVLAGGIKSPLYLNFLPIQGRACWEMHWTGLRQISCNPSLCSQHQEHHASPCCPPPLCIYRAAQLSSLSGPQTSVCKGADRSQSSVLSSSHPLAKVGAFRGTRLFNPESEQLPELLIPRIY